MKKYDIAIIGGDKRTAYMAPVLTKKGYSVICYGTSESPIDDRIYHADTLKDTITQASVIVCGIPFQKEGCLYSEKDLTKTPITELQRFLRKHHTVFGGIIPDEFRTVCEKRKISCFDFMQEEPLTIYNAIATAEGAILEALLHKPTQLHQSRTLVLGYGRCGKILADKLKGLSAQVTVCTASSKELAYATALGFQTMALSELPQKIGEFEYVFNTIPATVLTKACLAELDKDSLIVDIASNRIGVDYEAASQLNRHALFCPGLPGKYAAFSCAEQLADFVINRIF